MPGGRLIELPAGRVEVEERSGYLYLVESGQLRSLAELGVYLEALEAEIGRTGIRLAVIDARSEVGDPDPTVREAMWEWLSSPTDGFERVAFVLAHEMAVARVNMTALSRKCPVRAFDSVFAAQRWVTGRDRSNTSTGFRPPSAASWPVARSSRPDIEPPKESSPPERPSAASASAGRYHVSSAREERVVLPGQSARLGAKESARPGTPRSDFQRKGAGGEDDEGSGGAGGGQSGAA